MLQGINILYENNSLVHYYFPIVQWGFANDSGQWRKVIHLPIDFKSFSSILAVGINSDDSANCGYHLNSKELNSFSYVYGVSLCYIAIGV